MVRGNTARYLLILGVIVLVVSGTVLISRDNRRELARTSASDGAATVVVGRERLFGLLGIEIIHEQLDPTGRVVAASVKGECSSWREARQKYSTAP